MLSDWELWACANRVLQSHGKNASLHAAEQIEALTRAGDADGARAWRQSRGASHSSPERTDRQRSTDAIRRGSQRR